MNPNNLSLEGLELENKGLDLIVDSENVPTRAQIMKNNIVSGAMTGGVSGVGIPLAFAALVGGLTGLNELWGPEGSTITSDFDMQIRDGYSIAKGVAGISPIVGGIGAVLGAIGGAVKGLHFNLTKYSEQYGEEREQHDSQFNALYSDLIARLKEDSPDDLTQAPAFQSLDPRYKASLLIDFAISKTEQLGYADYSVLSRVEKQGAGKYRPNIWKTIGDLVEALPDDALERSEKILSYKERRRLVNWYISQDRIDNAKNHIDAMYVDTKTRGKDADGLFQSYSEELGIIASKYEEKGDCASALEIHEKLGNASDVERLNRTINPSYDLDAFLGSN